MVAEPDVAFSCGRVDIDSQASDARFAFEERHVFMRFRVFEGRAEEGCSWGEQESLVSDFEVFDLVVLLGVQDLVDVGCEVLAEMHVVAVRAQVVAGVRFDNDLAAFDRGENGEVGEDHGLER